MFPYIYLTQPCGRLFRKPAALLIIGMNFLLPFPAIGGARNEAIADFRYAESSPELLAQAVLRAIAGEDLSEMDKLALSKEEFARFVWPELPVSNPRSNISLNYVWDDLAFRSRSHMRAAFQRLKKRDLSLVRVRHLGRVVEYLHHRAYPDMEVILREGGGEEKTYPLFGTLIERSGRWKVYSYAPYN